MTIDAGCLSVFTAGESEPPSLIDPARYRLKMVGVDTAVVAASVVNLESFRDGSDEQLPYISVGSDLSWSDPTARAEESSIPGPDATAYPFPAIAVGVNKRPESFGFGHAQESSQWV